MNSEEIINVLNEIADRIGASAESIYPALVRYGVVSNMFGVVASALAIYAAYKIYSNYKDKLDDDDFLLGGAPLLLMILALFMFILGSIFFVLCAHELVGWIAAPEVMAIKMVLGGGK